MPTRVPHRSAAQNAMCKRCAPSPRRRAGGGTARGEGGGERELSLSLSTFFLSSAFSFLLFLGFSLLLFLAHPLCPSSPPPSPTPFLPLSLPSLSRNRHPFFLPSRHLRWLYSPFVLSDSPRRPQLLPPCSRLCSSPLQCPRPPVPCSARRDAPSSACRSSRWPDRFPHPPSSLLMRARSGGPSRLSTLPSPPAQPPARSRGRAPRQSGSRPRMSARGALKRASHDRDLPGNVQLPPATPFLHGWGSALCCDVL